MLFALPRVIRWLRKELPCLQTDGFHDGAPSPKEQAFQIFWAFIVGRPLHHMAGLPNGLKSANRLKPPQDGVWELRTFDLRFFGWFPRKGTFIISCVETKQRCIEHRLYAGYRTQAIRDREELGLGFVDGGYDDCF